MPFSCGDLCDPGGENLRGGVPVGGGAVTELTIVIQSKGVQGSIGLENERVFFPKQGGANEKGEEKNHPIPKQAQPGQGMGFVSQAAHLGFELIFNARGGARYSKANLGLDTYRGISWKPQKNTYFFLSSFGLPKNHLPQSALPRISN